MAIQPECSLSTGRRYPTVGVLSAQVRGPARARGSGERQDRRGPWHRWPSAADGPRPTVVAMADQQPHADLQPHIDQLVTDQVVPDTKDWTWTLERPCPDCGFEA